MRHTMQFTDKRLQFKRLENLWHFCSQKYMNKSKFNKFHGKVNKLIKIYCLCENTEQKVEIKNMKERSLKI